MQMFRFKEHCKKVALFWYNKTCIQWGWLCLCWISHILSWQILMSHPTTCTIWILYMYVLTGGEAVYVDQCLFFIKVHLALKSRCYLLGIYQYTGTLCDDRVYLMLVKVESCNVRTVPAAVWRLILQALRTALYWRLAFTRLQKTNAT